MSSVLKKSTVFLLPSKSWYVCNIQHVHWCAHVRPGPIQSSRKKDTPPYLHVPPLAGTKPQLSSKMAEIPLSIFLSTSLGVEFSCTRIKL